MTISEFSIKYARKGKHIFPVYEITEAGVCACGNPECSSPGKHPRIKNGFKGATTDIKQIQEWWSEWPSANIGMIPDPGLFILDVDPRAGGSDSLKALIDKYGPLPETVKQKTGGGGEHYFFTYPKDQPFKSSSGQLAPGVDIKAEGGYIILAPSNHKSGKRYQWTGKKREPAPAPPWLIQWERQRHEARLKTKSQNQTGPIPEGSRNKYLTSEAGRLRSLGYRADEISTALSGLNRSRCHPRLSDSEVERIAASVGRYPAGVPEEYFYQEPQELERKTPSPLNLDNLLSDPISDCLRAYFPYTEASFEAMYFQALVFFGIAIGRTAYVVPPGAGKHFLNLNCCIVGKTARARKGTSLIPVEEIFRAADTSLIPDRRVSGLSSGEGIIHAVRDPRWEVKTQHGESTEQLVDSGIDDKRLLIVEGEFSNVLINFSRKDNKLSAVLRDAWDNKDLRTMTKNSPENATAPHIGFCAHITEAELKNLLANVQISNGFSNRILWIYAERSKFLSRSPDEPFDFIPYAEDLKESIDYVKSFSGCLLLTSNAQSLWNEAYPQLEADRRNEYINALTARAAPTVLRMAGILALLTRDNKIQSSHLQQALDFWRYAEDSMKHIFGDSTGNRDADNLLYALRKAGPEGMTRTEISELFQRHKTKDQLDVILAVLRKPGLADFKVVGNAEIWYLKN